MKHYSNHFPIFLSLLAYWVISCQDKKATPDEIVYDALSQKAHDFEEQFQTDSAYYYHQQAKNSLMDKSSEEYSYSLLKMAMILHHNGDHTGCEEVITEALANYKQTTYLPYLYNLLASSYYRLHNPNDALTYYKKALESSSTLNEKLIYQNNIALIHLETNDHLKAITILQPLLLDENLKNNPFEYARVQDNLGFAQFRLQMSEAYHNLTQAWKLRDSLQDDLGQIASAMHLSEYYHTLDPQKARQFADAAYRASRRVNSPDDQLEALKWLTEFGETHESKKFYQRYIQLNDSITKVRYTAKNQFAKIRYDSKKATLEVQKYKNQKVFLLVLIGLLLVIVFLLYQLNQVKNKRKSQQLTYLTETRISKRIHDELANDVFTAMTFTQTQNLENPIAKEALLDNLEHIYQRTRDIAKENSDIRTDDNYEYDLFQLIDGYADNNLNVIRKVKVALQWQKISSEKKITLQRIIQEFLINTKKHSKASLVVIDISEDKKNIILTYTDNGIGFRDTPHRKSGLQNAENRILAIKGSITFDNTIRKGFKVSVVIPK